MAQYDVDQIIRQFAADKCPECGALVREMTQELTASRARVLLIEEIAEGCLANNLPPGQALSVALMYGVVLGILLEKHRVEDDRRIIH